MKFLAVADTHWGGKNLCGFQMQPRYTENLDELLTALERLVQQEKVEFVLHLGDMTDNGAEEEIKGAVSRFKKYISVPVLLTAGNHDVSRAESERYWLKYAPEFFPDGTLDRTLFIDGVRFDLISLFWGENERRWTAEKGQFINLSSGQLERLRNGEQSVPRVIAMHSQIRAIAPEKTGMSEPWLVPENNFAATGDALIEEFSPMLILGGHNHLNLLDRIGDTIAVTASSFAESPFECKIVEYDAGILSIRTAALGDKMSFEYMYEPENSYVQGYPDARGITVEVKKNSF